MFFKPIVAAENVFGLFLFNLPVIVGIVLLYLYFFKRKTIFKIDYAGGSIGFDTQWIGQDEAINFQKDLRIYKDLANSNATSNIQINNSMNISVTDELVRYNELLHQGVITQEDYDAKKRQLLGL